MAGPAAAPPRPDPAAGARRSRAVAWAKVLLPLAALALLSTVFLLAREPGTGGEAALPFARASAIARDPRIEAPRLAGVAADGTALTLGASRIRPGAAPGAFALEAPWLEAEAPDGAKLRAAAPQGGIDPDARTLTLAGGVRVEADGGIVAEAPALRADLRAGTLRVEGPVAATAPMGAITAGGLLATRGDGRTARLVFNGGVRLLYRPGNELTPSESPP